MEQYFVLNEQQLSDIAPVLSRTKFVASTSQKYEVIIKPSKPAHERTLLPLILSNKPRSGCGLPFIVIICSRASSSRKNEDLRGTLLELREEATRLAAKVNDAYEHEDLRAIFSYETVARTSSIEFDSTEFDDTVAAAGENGCRVLVLLRGYDGLFNVKLTTNAIAKWHQHAPVQVMIYQTCRSVTSAIGAHPFMNHMFEDRVS
jgi:hypothetical protein